MDEEKLIDEALQHLLDDFDPWQRNREMIEYIIKAGGKRTRPLILILTCKMLGGDVKKALNAALAVELMHTASLIHDDILDRGKTRRGVETVNEKFGFSSALLCGDFLISKSIHLGAEYDEEVIKELAMGGMDMAEGEILDIEDSLDEEGYFDMICKKTATLFSSSFSIGGLIAGVKKEETDRLRKVGKDIGMAYQIVDDLLEFIGAYMDKKSEVKSMTLPRL
ncbi:MAG: polyprenyl synthetase family protein, partial [Candidatus Syntropharchaeia archaeon]